VTHARRWLAALVAAGLPACLALAGSHGEPPMPTAAAAPSRAGVRAQLLAGEPAVATVALGSFSSRRQARRIASVLARRIPLPAGGNFSGIRWERAGGALTTSQIDAALEFNAACQWLRALRDGREMTTAISVLRLVPNWPALRAQQAGAPWLRNALAQAISSGGGEYLTMLADCDASHAREARYAHAHGRPPST
jgi:hypothetical protein